MILPYDANPGWMEFSERTASELAGVSEFNVIKLKGETISLLLYEDFDSASFPALLEAHTINLSGRSVSRSGVVTLSLTERNLPTIANVDARDFSDLACWLIVQIGPISLNVTTPQRSIVSG
jgi:hypothetical protein